MGSRLDQIPNLEVTLCDSGYNLSVMAKSCGVCQRQLRRFIHTSYGKCPSVWRDEVRMGAAILLILNGECIKDIAVKLGFANGSEFCRAFKRVVGMSPHKFFMLKTSGLRKMSGLALTKSGLAYHFSFLKLK
jgi:AraC-like DNA-binding protein